MVRAILDGRKTMTRRPVKQQPEAVSRVGRPFWWVGGFRLDANARNPLRCPYGVVGDQLWVRETWQYEREGTGCPDDNGFLYRATDPGWDDNGTGLRWRSPIHMPRRASRITLEVTDVRVERVQDISDADAIAEGVNPQDWPVSNIPAAMREPHGYAFAQLWDFINAKRGYSWESNPWVWVVCFKRIGGEA